MEQRMGIGAQGSEIDNRLSYRKGWPSTLPILHLSFKPIAPQDVPDLIYDQRAIEDGVQAVLAQHGVDICQCAVGHRFREREGKPTSDNITMMFYCKKMDTLSAEALEEMRRVVRANGWSRPVEFIGQEEADAPCYPILGDEPIVREWEDVHWKRVEDRIADEKWQTVSVLRCGNAENENDCPITVIISSWDAIDDIWWDNIVPTIRGETKLQVRLLQAEEMLSILNPGDTILTFDDFSDPVFGGASLSPHKHEATGTLGGFLSLKLPSRAMPISVGISNHHVVKEKRLSKETKLGRFLPPSNHLAENRCLRVVSPSDHDREAMKLSLTTETASLRAKVDGDPVTGVPGLKQMIGDGDSSKQKDLEKVLEEIRALQRKKSDVEKFNRILGTVWATSGYRTVKKNELNWCVDWSLVLLDRPRTTEKGFKHGQNGYEKLDRWRRQLLVEGSWVYKKGRTTGYTHGRVSTIQTRARIWPTKDKGWGSSDKHSGETPILEGAVCQVVDSSKKKTGRG